jgi:hypothetical protein
MTPEQKAQQIIDRLVILDGWQKLSIARKIALACMDAVVDNEEKWEFYFQVFKQIEKQEL